MGFYRGVLSFICVAASSASFAGVVSPEVAAMVRQHPNTSVDVVFYVESPPPFVVASEVKKDYAARIKYFANRAKSFAKTAQLRPLNGIEAAQRRRVLQIIDETLNERGDRIVEALQNAAAPNMAAVRNAIESYGGAFLDDSAVLATVRGLVPARHVAELAKHPLVTYVGMHVVGGPMLDNQKQSLGLTAASGFWADGIDGGVFDAGVMDTGSQRNHPAFAGLDWEGVTTDPDGHGTGVSGMIFSNDATYRGMAYGLGTVSVADAKTGMHVATDWLLTETTQRAEAINVSWGGQSVDPTDYRDIEAFYDSAADTFEITFGQAAGNTGSAGFESLTWPGKAYNTICVANVYDEDTVTRSDDAIWGTSSRGPTPNGRKKPDIAAPGNDTMTTTRTLGFGNLGGTSSAAPKVTGGAVLLRDFGLTNSRADKAVLINSADAWSDSDTLDSEDDGPLLGHHWSRSYGWGYLNLERAHRQAPFVIEDSFERPIIVGSRKLAYYAGERPISFKATLVWNRHVGTYTGEDPVEHDTLTNFNLGLYSGTTGNSISQSNSTIDNVEQVGTFGSGSSVLKVSTIGNWDIDVPSEDFALAVPSEFVRKDPPRFDVEVSAAEYAVVGSEIVVSGNVTNIGELPAYNVLASIDAHVVGGNNPTQLGTVDPGETVPVTWEIEVEQSAGPQMIRLSVEGVGYGETFTSFGEAEVEVIPFYLAPTSFTTVRGTVTSGNLASVTSSNNAHLIMHPGVTLTSSQWPVELIFTGTAPVTSPNHFYARVESNGTSINIHQKVEVYDYAASQWVQLSSQPLTTGDTTLVLSPPAPLSRFIEPGTRQIRIRLSAKAFGPVLSYPWRYRIDQVGWHIAN